MACVARRDGVQSGASCNRPVGLRRNTPNCRSRSHHAVIARVTGAIGIDESHIVSHLAQVQGGPPAKGSCSDHNDRGPHPHVYSRAGWCAGGEPQALHGGETDRCTRGTQEGAVRHGGVAHFHTAERTRAKLPPRTSLIVASECLRCTSASVRSKSRLG